MKTRKAVGVRGFIVNKGTTFRVFHDDGVGFDDHDICAEDFDVLGNGVEGCILYCPFRVTEDHEIIPDPDRGHYFRVYGEKNTDGHKDFTDYDPEGIEFVITGSDVIFVCTPNRKFLGWTEIVNRQVPGARAHRSVIKDGKLVKDENGKLVWQDGTWDEDLRFVPDEKDTKDE